MSNLSDLLPSGAGGKQVDFVASATLSNGQTVILNTNGTVTAITGSGSAESIPSGSVSSFQSGVIYRTCVSMDPNNANKFIIAYAGGTGGYGRIAVGTISGNSISFGSDYVFSSVENNGSWVAFDPNTAGKFVVVYRASSSQANSKVGIVSGSTVSYGSAVTFNSANTRELCIGFDPNTANRFVVTYSDLDAAGRSKVGTVSGTSISYGSEATFESGNSIFNSIAFDPNTENKFVVSYKDAGDSNKGKSVVGVISSTSISYGTPVMFNNAVSQHVDSSFDPNTENRFVVAYYDGGNGSYGTCNIGTVNGTTLSFSSKFVFNSAVTDRLSVDYDPNNNGKLAIAFRDAPNAGVYPLSAIAGTVSSTSITYGSKSTLESTESTYPSLFFNPNTSGQFVTGFSNAGNSRGAAVLGQISTISTNLTATNFIGVTDAAIANSATGSVTIKGGTTTNLSSLTVNSVYYVQANGAISTVSAAPAVRIGRALSSTSINLEFTA